MHREEDLQRTPLAVEAIIIIPWDNFVQGLSPCVVKWNKSPRRSRVEAWAVHGSYRDKRCSLWELEPIHSNNLWSLTQICRYHLYAPKTPMMSQGDKASPRCTAATPFLTPGISAPCCSIIWANLKAGILHKSEIMSVLWLSSLEGIFLYLSGILLQREGLKCMYVICYVYVLLLKKK